MRGLFYISLFLIPFVSSAQLVTNNSQSPTALVQDILLGDGVTVSNITFSGSPIALGAFTATNTNLGIDAGIILTTGTIFNTGDGPHGPNNTEDSGMDNGAGGYGLLSNLINESTFNAGILEFDFVTYSDSVEFKYVFGSEEYLEYVNAGFNDVFAFFISGPGITGVKNMALLPNGNTVSIDNIHTAGTNIYGNTFSASNPQYYVNNNGGSSIQYDGFTSVLTARSKVQCGETYHLRIAIADAGDPIFDSGIFLEANSLTSHKPIESEHLISQDLYNSPDIIAEGCVSATFTLNRNPNFSTNSLTIPVVTGGTATNGVDYTGVPTSVTFPPGVSTISFSFQALEDGITEGLETLDISFLVTDPCGNVTPLLHNLFIQDIEPLSVTIDGANPTCPGDPIELFANISGGGEPYDIQWNTGETTPSIFVSPNSTQTYSVSVTDGCLMQTDNDSYQVVVPVYPPLDLNPTPDITKICPYVPELLESNATGGLAPYTYNWDSNVENNLGTAADYTAIPSQTTTYTVTVTDFCGETTNADIVYTITSPPLLVDMSPAVEVCPGDSVLISTTSTGGWGQHFYSWSHSTETTPDVWVNPMTTTVYEVSVSDECQTFTVEDTTSVIVRAPIADFTSTSTVFFNGLPITFQNLSQDAISYEWTFGDGNDDTQVHTQNTYDVPGQYIITLIATDWKGCKDTIQKPILIEEEWWFYAPNTITPDGDRFNGKFRASTIGIRELNISIFNRWGEIVFQAHDPNFEWDATYDGIYVPDGTYVYKVEFITNSGRERKINGHVNVLR